ncbi:MAG: CBS domain-containing protein [Leptospirillia bacterium]
MTTLVTTHPSADFDGVATMVAARHFYPDAVLAFSGSAEEKVRTFFSEDAPVTILNPKQVNLSDITRVVLCDTHGAGRAGHFSGLCEKLPVHIYDHHPHAEHGVPPEVAVVEPVGASVTLMTERLQAEGIQLTEWEATLMSLGLHEETGSLTFVSTTPRDALAAAWLIEQGADLKAVRTHLEGELTLEQLELMDELAHQIEVRYIDGCKVGVAAAYAPRYIPEVAGIANRIMAMQPMDVLLLLIAMEDKVLLVARGNKNELPLGELAGHFGGGGHPTAASAMIHDHTLVEVKDAVWKMLDDLIAPLRRARDIMTPAPVMVDRDTPLTEVEALLTRYGVNTLPVMHDERLLGLISRETVQKGLHHGMDKVPALDVMEADPYTVTPDVPFRQVRDRMVSANQRYVPVLRDGKLVGCITRTDLVRAMHEDLKPAGTGDELPSPHRRSVAERMRHSLPEAVYDLLVEIGQDAVRQEVEVFMAGGIVRDLLLDRTNLDVDLVVEGGAIPFAEAWAQKSGARVHTHARFGTATVTMERPTLPPHFKVDFASARTEFYEYPSALPIVEQSSLKKDLYRRDFTINALAVCLTPPRFGMLIDYFGGQRDLKQGQVRVLHTLSFTEDPTRALRAVRFATRYGFEIGSHTARLIGNAGKMGLYARLSGKRLLTELIYLLSETEPAEAVATLGRLDILAGIDPRFDADCAAERVARCREAITWYRLQYIDRPLEEWQVYLLGLTDGLPAEAHPEFWERLDLPGRLRAEWGHWERLPEQAKACFSGASEPAPIDVHKCLGGAPPEVLAHLMAATEDEPVKKAVSAYLSRISMVHVLLTGDDLTALGMTPGPLYREVLDGLLTARLNGEVESREDEIDWVKRTGYL